MAGSPTFTRAKHFTHFHTAHKSVFEGAETVHTKTNLTASIDGDYEMKADKALFDIDNASIDGNLDVKRNKLLNPKNVLRTEKVTITHTDVSATGLISGNATVTLFRASPGDTIYDVVGNSRVAWTKGASIDKLRFEVGDKADPNGFTISHLASPVGWIWDGQDGTEKGAYLRGSGASPIRRYKTYTVATLIKAIVTASLYWGASLDGGASDFYVDVMSRA